MKFSIKKRLQSFKYAFSGIVFLIKEEHNFRIHVLATIVVVLFGFFFKITNVEWLAIIFAIGIVLITEALNTSIEKLADRVTKNNDEAIKIVKDTAAFAVLISSVIAVIIGLIVFYPYLSTYF